MFERPGVPRERYVALFNQLASLPPAELRLRRPTLQDVARTRRHLRTRGRRATVPRDLIPRLIADREWDVLERGIAQRVHALERFL